MKGKQCVLLANLAPRKLKGIESQGMILAAGSKDEGFVLLSPSEKVKEGSGVGWDWNSQVCSIDDYESDFVMILC